MMLQIDPPLSVLTPLGEGWALFLIDYGVHLNSVWVVSLWESGQVFHVDSAEIKIAGNPMYDIKEPEEYTERKV